MPKSTPKENPKNHDNSVESIDSKNQPQPETRLPEAPHRPPEVRRGRPEAPGSCPEAPKRPSIRPSATTNPSKRAPEKCSYLPPRRNNESKSCHHPVATKYRSCRHTARTKNESYHHMVTTKGPPCSNKGGSKLPPDGNNETSLPPYGRNDANQAQGGVGRVAEKGLTLTKRRTRCAQLAMLCFLPWPGGMRKTSL